MPDPFDIYLSSPAVWNGAVYFGSGDGNVYALDAATGVLKWKYQTGDVVHASPAIAHGTVFIGSWDSYMYALDAATGALKWRFKTGEDPDIHNQQGIQSSAAVADGIVYFGCRDSHLYAVDEKTGKQRWVFSTKPSWVITSPAVRNGIVYAATSDSGLFFALDAKNGAQIFSVAFHHWPMFSSPALVDGFAYIGSEQGKLLAIDLKNRREAWEFQTDASKSLLPAYSNPDGSVNYYAVQAGNFYDDVVVAVDKLMNLGQVHSSPLLAGNTLIFGATDGNVYALEGSG
jgi:outer membrane protein assembly factor BamB